MVARGLVPAHHARLILLQVAGDVPWDRDAQGWRRGKGGEEGGEEGGERGREKNRMRRQEGAERDVRRWDGGREGRWMDDGVMNGRWMGDGWMVK